METSRYAREPNAVVLVREVVRRGGSLDDATAALLAAGEFAEWRHARSWARREYLYAAVRRAEWARRDQ